MGIIGWILLGIVGGVIAKALLPGNDPGGLIVTIIIGVVGALLGGFLARALGLGDPIDEFFDVSTWLAAIIGSMILLVIYRAVTGRSLTGGPLRRASTLPMAIPEAKLEPTEHGAFRRATAGSS